MLSVLMALQWFHGRMENCSFGMRPARTLLLPPYISSATSEAGAVAALAEERKKNVYAHLDPSHSFTPVAVKTSGIIGPQSLAFLKDLGRRMRQVISEERSLSYLLQRVSLAVQRGNATSVLSTTGLAVPDTSIFLVYFFLLLSCLFFFCLIYVSLACLCFVCFSPCLFTSAVVLVFLCHFPILFTSFSLV